MHDPGPTSPDLHAGVWAGVEAGEDGEVGVLVQGGHHHPEHQDQQTRAPLHVTHHSLDLAYYFPLLNIVNTTTYLLFSQRK